MTELAEKLVALEKERLTVDEFKAKATSLGCKRIIGKGQIATREYRSDGSRCFIKVDDGIVTGVRIG